MLKELHDALCGKRTYISAGLLILVCIAEQFGYDVVPGIDKSNALATAWESGILMFIRAGIAAKA
jgi:hypothetical protein